MASIKVMITPIEPLMKMKKPNGRKMVEAVEKLAALGGRQPIPDPDKWL